MDKKTNKGIPEGNFAKKGNGSLQMVMHSTKEDNNFVDSQVPGSPYHPIYTQDRIPEVPPEKNDGRLMNYMSPEPKIGFQAAPVVERNNIPEYPSWPEEPEYVIFPEETEVDKVAVQQDDLVRALDELLKQHPEEALRLLEGYSPGRREILMRLMAAVDQLHTDKEAQLDPEGVKILSDQLEGILVSLRPRSRLLIDRMSLCRCVKAYGSYTPMQADHVYRAATASVPGEKVLLYVQLRNLCSDKRNDVYQTILSSKARIHNKETGKEVWSKNFGDHRQPMFSETIRNDYFVNYSFPVPIIPPGQYTLTIEVSDVTRPDSVRTARESVDLRVRN